MSCSTSQSEEIRRRGGTPGTVLGGVGAARGMLCWATSGGVCLSDGTGGHGVSEASKRVSEASKGVSEASKRVSDASKGVSDASKRVPGGAMAPSESLAGLMVPGGSERHQLAMPRRTDNLPNPQ